MWVGFGSRTASARSRRAAGALALALIAGAGAPGARAALTIALDPGHGGIFSGGGSNEYCLEKNLNLTIANELSGQFLQGDARFTAFLTRTGDFTVALVDRVREAVDAGADAFVSIHHNCCAVSTEYTMVAYTVVDSQAVDGRGEESRDLAVLAAGFLHSLLTSEYGYVNNGAEDHDFFVLRNNPIAPSILGEAAFAKWSDGSATVIGRDLCLDLNDTVGREAQGYFDALSAFYPASAVAAPAAAAAGPATPGPSLRAIGLGAETILELALPVRASVRIRIHDVRGRYLAEPVTGILGPGVHHVRWDARDRGGAPVGSGVYFARMVLSPGPVRTARVVIVH